MINRAIVRVTPEFIVSLFQGKYEVIENPVPEGCRIVDCGYEARDGGTFWIIMQGDGIPGTIEGGSPVELTPRIRRILDHLCA